MKPEAHLPPADYARAHPVLADPGETRMLDHLPQLDGVRAVAVGMVLWAHYMPRQFGVRGGPPWGAIGVGVFFVLSGFLITRILLNGRLKVADGRSGLGNMLKQFYVRRFLRIFPLYYAVLLVLWITNGTGFRQRAWYSIFYFTNYRFSYEVPVYAERWLRRWLLGDKQKALNLIHWDQTRPHIERHLWSLSVEEQFYVVWPLLVLLCPRRLLLPMILVTIAVGPVWRTHTYVVGMQGHEWMTPGCLDLLGMGALLALLSLPRFSLTRWRDGFVQICGLIGVPAVIAFVAQRWYPTVEGKNLVPTAVSYDWLDYGGAAYPITALAAVWLIGTAAKGFRGPIGWFLTSAPVVYVGRISYGLYVVHMLVPEVMIYLMPGVFDTTRGWVHFFTYTSISLAIASLSWFAFESPVNGLKRYFEYDKTAAARAETSAVAA